MSGVWVTGPHHGLRWPVGLAVIDGSADLDAIVALWTACAEGRVDDLASFLAELAARTGTDLLHLPGFAVAVAETDGTRLAARGSFTAEVALDDGAIEVSGVGVSTWSERHVPTAGPTRAHHRLPQDRGGVRRPIVGGVVPASELATDTVAQALHPTEARPAEPTPAPEPPPRTTPIPAPGLPLLETLVPPADDEPASTATTASPAPPPQDEPSEEGFADLWTDETLAGSVESAAVRPGPAPGRVAGNADPSAPATLGDHAGDTIAGEPEPPRPDPVVSVPPIRGPLARRCPAGHPNPPSRPRCRVCADALVGEPAALDGPPVLGRLVTPTGERVDLDTDVVVGRAPRAARFTGTAAPHLLVVDRPHVSASHVALRRDAWSLVALDLGSTNGSYLRKRDRSAVRLSDHPEPVAPGDEIDLGHGVRFTFEELP